jgi:DNA/RNA endonuclease G (NUC1)
MYILAPMKYFSIVLLAFAFPCTAQTLKVDGTIRELHYTSYFCNSTKGPLYVVYKLRNGGGNGCNTAETFINDSKYTTATDKDYKHAVYTRGQMAEAFTFGYDCELAKKTFRYYNCLPMADILKNGLWKTWDETIATESQTDDLRITAGAIFDNAPATIGDGVAVPKYFYKLVYSYNTHRYTHAFLFSNDMDATVREIPVKEIERLAGYKIWYE